MNSREISRRDFVRYGGAIIVGGAVAATGLPGLLHNIVLGSNPRRQVQAAGDMARGEDWRFIVNIRKCIGCGQCARACKIENDVPLRPEFNRTWVERYVMLDNGEALVDSPNAGIDGFGPVELGQEGHSILKSFFVPKLCNQCQRPPCVQVCPVGATFKTDDGVVLVNRKACIGCRYCIQACPYGARFLDPRLRVVDKCTWCYHRITKGLPPACVEACPTGARVFGDALDPQGPIRRLLVEETMAVLKPEVGTNPMVFYTNLERGVH